MADLINAIEWWQSIGGDLTPHLGNLTAEQIDHIENLVAWCCLNHGTFSSLQNQRVNAMNACQAAKTELEQKLSCQECTRCTECISHDTSALTILVEAT